MSIAYLDEIDRLRGLLLQEKQLLKIAQDRSQQLVDEVQRWRDIAMKRRAVLMLIEWSGPMIAGTRSCPCCESPQPDDCHYSDCELDEVL